MTAPARLGRYEIVRRLGKSMTDVYLAIDTVENRKAALKLIELGGDANNRAVMEAERRGAAIQKELQLIDPRMVEVYDVGDLDGYFFVAMQYVEGRNLSEVLRAENVVEANRAAVIALEICEQLAKFHSWQSTVVHGDIKPSNIHLGPNDTVRLLDFGIAKTLRADCDETAHQFGSPGYCSPERLVRSTVDQQSDLWAVGATLYEMLAGAPPFQADSTRKLESLIRSKRPPRALPASCPKALRLVVSKALAPEPAQRYRSAVDFQADLQAFLERRTTQAEMERRAAWGHNATMEAAREYLRKATRTIARVKRAVQIAGAMGWFAGGMVLWIGGSVAWEEWKPRPHVVKPAAVPAAPAPPTVSREEEMRSLYVRDAEEILKSYRASGSPSLLEFDWQKAEICLERAMQLGAADDRTAGELALSRGYAALQRLDGGSYPEEAAAKLRLHARDEFRTASAKMPAEAEPHLALARVYVYALPNVDEAMAEFAEAEKAGAKLGPREMEQQGDAYRMRGARGDRARARAFYEKARGYDRVEQHLKELDRMGKKTAGRRRRWR